MRSTLGLPTRGSSKSSTPCISTQSLWMCYFRNLLLSQQVGFIGGGSSASRASSHRCFSSSPRSSTSRSPNQRQQRTYRHWPSVDLDHYISSTIHPSYAHQQCRTRSKPCLKVAGHHHTSIRIKLSTSSLNSVTSTRYASSTSFDPVNQQVLSSMESTSQVQSSSGASTASATPSTPIERQPKSLLHPRWFNVENDIDHLLEELKIHNSHIDNIFIFKTLRSMLYNVSQYKHQVAWKIYEAMMEHKVTSYMRSNHYGHLLNIIKYAPDATPKLLQILDHMKTAQSEGRIMIGNRHYSQIMFGMSRQGDVVALCDLLRALVTHGQLQPSFYTSLAHAAKRNGNLAWSLVAAELMEEAMKHGVMMERKACAMMVSALSVDMNATVRFMTTMKETGMLVIDEDNNSNSNNNSGKDTQGSDSDATLDATTFNVHIYTSLISGLARNGDETNARRLWKAMRKNGLKPTTVTYAALIESYGRSGNMKAAVDLMKNYTFDNKGQLNKVMATSLLTNCIRHGKLDLAQSLLSTWVDKMNLTMDSKMDNEFWSAVMWVKVTEDVGHAREFYETLYRRNSSFADSVMVNHLVKGYGKARQKQCVLDSFGLHKMASSSIKSSSEVNPHFFLVDSLFQCRDVPAALTALVMMRRYSVPDDITMAMVIRGLVMNEENDMAWELFRTLKSTGVEPNLHAYTSILKTCIKNAKRGTTKQQRHQQQQHIPRDIVEASLEISNTTSSSATNGLLEHKKMGPTQAYILFRKLTGYQKPNAYTYTTLIACFAKHNIRRAVDIFTHMCSDGVKPAMETYVALLQGCAIFRNAPMALLIFNHMQEQQHLAPNDKVWHYLLKALVRTRTNKKEIDRLGRMVRTLRQEQGQNGTG
ncbi:hypothetical protein BCR42DRAFT_404411 [Absidia repens]|uniref:Pentacotripeptide-repeat region of PRORP domain-containing protein n=1 Tax=Absidia repens TaxID=90262 RepID=A0A1X2IW38_9FUNG|nr:hypothetical protein BCR42DRAFT_404411 [Absidia repens]